MPAITSSKVTPHPSFNLSILRAGGGLIMSNNLNRRNAPTKYLMSSGTNIKDITMPVTSSITMGLPSLPKVSSARVADHTLRKNKPMLIGTNI